MKRRSFLTAMAASATTLGSGPDRAAPGATDAAAAQPAGPPVPGITLTRRGRFGGRECDYNIIARSDAVTPVGSTATAEFYSYSYIVTSPQTPTPRPVIFSFNGGPGAASASLHLSGLGPRRVRFGDAYDAATLLAGEPLVDSEYSVLDRADLVFVDPPGTGYSRGVLQGDPAAFWNTTEDSRACAEFIRVWLGRHNRWRSPLYLIGESYGTVRLALVTRDLMGGETTGELPAIPVAGVLLVACVENRTQLVPQPTNDSYFQAYLPTFAATALYHGRASAGRALPELIDDVRRFTVETYGPTLYLGTRLDAERRLQVSRALAAYTGLPVELINRSNQRLTHQVFAARLLEDQARRLGKYDTRTVIGPTPGETGIESDPSMTQLQQAFGIGIGAYLSGELGLRSERAYRMINFVANERWKHNFPDEAAEYSDVSTVLASAMAVNVRMRVLALCGYYDLDAPFMGVEHTFQNPMFPRERVFIRRYESGHMCYVGEKVVGAFTGDVRAFVGGEGLEP